MIAARRSRAVLVPGLALVIAAAACQPLPHPFADDRPSAALIAVPDSIAIAVGQIEGTPHATAAKLSDAIASELLKHNIPASAMTTSRASYTLDGRIEESPPLAGQATVTVFWRLRDASGKIVHEHSNKVTAPIRDWEDGADAPVGQLASAGGDVLASLVTETAPKEEQASGRIRVAVRKIGGAPGDGDTALANAMTAILKRADIDIVDAQTGKPDIDIDSDITVEPKGNQQHVKIVWHVSRANGNEVGNVAQENDLPRGRLEGPWGDVAYGVAIAAGDGIMQLVERGAPPIKLGTAATAAATPPSAPVMGPDLPPTPAPGQTASPLATGPAPHGLGNATTVPGNIDSPEVNLPPIDVGLGAPTGTEPAMKPTPPEMPTIGPPPEVPILLPRRGVYLPY
jgi:hypothetical protein